MFVLFNYLCIYLFIIYFTFQHFFVSHPFFFFLATCFTFQHFFFSHPFLSGNLFYFSAIFSSAILFFQATYFTFQHFSSAILFFQATYYYYCHCHKGFLHPFQSTTSQKIENRSQANVQRFAYKFPYNIPNAAKNLGQPLDLPFKMTVFPHGVKKKHQVFIDQPHTTN